MRDEDAKKSKLSWSKKLVRKLFYTKSKEQKYNANDGGDYERRSSFPEHEAVTLKKNRTCCSTNHVRSSRRDSIPGRVHKGKINPDSSQVIDIQEYRIFVATWNVGGKSPTNSLNMEDWLHTSPADVYVLGFQEIVPLNAGNVLGTENNGPARKWIALISKALNNPPGDGDNYHAPFPDPNPLVELDADFEGSSDRQQASSLFHRHSFHSSSHNFRMDGGILLPQPSFGRRFSVCDQIILGSRPSDCDSYYGLGGSSDDEIVGGYSPSPDYYSPMSHCHGAASSMEEKDRYYLVASKQMVGIFLTVWVRNEIKDDVRNMKVSCVGRGLMGYLGNKGSISISMALHQTTFCFICSHLTSGQKEGDELRRNADVMEILRKTRFPRVQGQADKKSPETILDHDRIIWLGDLNYRIALSYRTAKALVEMHNWKVLLANDQLRMERRRGHIFQGWHEGSIYFAPTYKYLHNSDRYAGDDMNPKEKRRTPAWCDRILWHGRGLDQLSYVRGESRFSDHRPVYSIFLAVVESVNHSRRKNMFSSSRIEVEELLPYSQGYTEFGFC